MINGEQFNYDTNRHVEKCMYHLERLEDDVRHIFCSGEFDYWDERYQYLFNCYKRSLEESMKSIHDLLYLAEQLSEVL